MAIAASIGAAEAARATSIPVGTIRCWMHRERCSNGEAQRNGVTQRRTSKLKALEEKVVAQAVAEAGDYVRDRLKQLVDEFYGLAEDGVKEARAFMAKPGEKDRDSAQWLRAAVGAMHYGLQDAQLLAGGPTERHEVNVDDARSRLASRIDELAARRAARPAAG